MRDGLSLCEAYVFFRNFIRMQLKSMFMDPHFKPVQAIFLIFRLVLKYEDPIMMNYFLQNNVYPEHFATPWFLTLFAGKFNDVNLIFLL